MANYESYSVVYTDPQTVVATFTYSGTAPAVTEVTGVLLNEQPLKLLDGPPTPSVPGYFVVQAGNALVVSVYLNAGYATILRGILEVDFTTATDDVVAIIPMGATLSSSTEGEDEVTVTIDGDPSTSAVAGNGMIHVGLYYENEDEELVPIWDSASDTDPIQVKTYTVFIDSYPTATPAFIAKSIVTNVSRDSAFPSGYTIAPDLDDPASVILTSENDQQLYIYLFDDNLIKALNVALDDDGQPLTSYPIIAGNKPDEGILPIVPDYSEEF